MGDRANPADAGGDYGHELGRASDAEGLEAPQLRDLEVGVLHLSLFVEEDGHAAMPFEPGYRVDGYLLHCFITFLSRMDEGRLYM